MKTGSIRGALLAALLLLGASAATQAATQTYYLQYMTAVESHFLQPYFHIPTPYATAAAWGDNSGQYATSMCWSCTENVEGIGPNSSLAVLDTETGAISINNLLWEITDSAKWLSISEGTTTLGEGVSFNKSSDFCFAMPSNKYYWCDPNDIRGWGGDWLTGYAGDGTTVCNTCSVDVTLTDNGELVMTVKKMVASSESSPWASWWSYSFHYKEVPVPAAFWLFGGALGGLGMLRRRRNR